MDLVNLKTRVKIQADSARHTREAERHSLNNTRRVRGRVVGYSKKHQKDKEKPNIDEAQEKKTVRAVTWAREHPEDAIKFLDTEEAKFWGLHRFRTHILRKESRATLLAYGFLRGVPYVRMESDEKAAEEGKIQSSCYEYPDFERVRKLAKRSFDGGNNAFNDAWGKWQTEAKRVLEKTFV